jgi:hypothetical protein
LTDKENFVILYLESEGTTMAKYANHYGYSDINPYEVIKMTPKTILVREMKSELDPNFKPQYVKGVFSAVCVNQHEQNWIITPDENAPIERAYGRKDGFHYIKRGKLVLSDIPVKYYDYNF